MREWHNSANGKPSHCKLPVSSNRLLIYNSPVEVTIRFKRLDLIDRVPDELWTEVRDIAQETGIKTIPKKKKCKKARLPEEALQIAEKIRDLKSKGERHRYTHLNAEFQRRARRDKKGSSAINAKK